LFELHAAMIPIEIRSCGIASITSPARENRVSIGPRKKPAVSWSLFLLIAGYVAVNVALTRVLSSPLTWQMSRAAGGALARAYLGSQASPATIHPKKGI
jgi:hypothetical protein